MLTHLYLTLAQLSWHDGLTSENAVKTQIWIAISTYLLITIMKKRLHSDHRSLYEILQIPSLSIFEKIQINQLFTPASKIQSQILSQISSITSEERWDTTGIWCRS